MSGNVGNIRNVHNVVDDSPGQNFPSFIIETGTFANGVHVEGRLSSKMNVGA